MKNVRQVQSLLGESRGLESVEQRMIPGSRKVSGHDIADAIRSMAPWLYLRFTDGTLFSMCGGTRRGANADGSHFHPATCGKELRVIFNEAYAAIACGAPITMELPNCWAQWPAVREAVKKMTPVQLAATVVGPVLTRAVVDGSVFEILDALRDSQSRKAWVAQAADRQVVEAAGMTMIEAPRPDAWNHIDELDSTVAAWACGAPVLLATTIGLPSRCLQWRRWDGKSVNIDLGSTADAMMGRTTRHYMRRGRQCRAFHARFLKWKERDDT